MIANPLDEKKTLLFLQGLLSLYIDNDVTTVYDYDYCAFEVSGKSIGFPEYNGEENIVHYPTLDPDGRERVNEIGDRLFGEEVVKTVDKPDADKIHEANPMRYDLKCYVYPDRLEYFIVASAYNEQTYMYEQREKGISVKELSGDGQGGVSVLSGPILDAETVEIIERTRRGQ